jgi:hypothetical protein
VLSEIHNKRSMQNWLCHRHLRGAKLWSEMLCELDTPASAPTHRITQAK